MLRRTTTNACSNLLSFYLKKRTTDSVCDDELASVTNIRLMNMILQSYFMMEIISICGTP
jgi:hypothetical protein